jgi:glycosyltransferase involved in cell wall biosynthesis
MEAMAARLPVIATAVGESPELVDTGVSGILVPPGDMERLADALGSLASNGDRRRTMGDAAAARAAGLGVEPMVQAYANLFERVKCNRSLSVAASCSARAHACRVEAHLDAIA